MFRCSPRPGGKALRPLWPPPRAYGISRGVKLSAINAASSTGRGGPDRRGPNTSLEGWQHLKELSAHNIGLYKEQKPARRLDWDSIKVRIARRHTIHWFDMECFTGNGRPYTVAVCRRYLTENVKPLWWTARVIAQAKPIVRNKGSSRMNVAFREALREAGYDVEGRRKTVPDGQQARARGGTQRGRAPDEPWRKKVVQLYGTVEIIVHGTAKLHKTPFRDLQAYFARVVRGLEEELGRTADGGLGMPSQAQSARGTSDGEKPRGGASDRQKHDRQSDQPQRSRPQGVRNAEVLSGKPQMAGGVRRLDLRRPANRDRQPGAGGD